ncbi:MAG: hypothetical protein HY876_05030 [Coriobacteriales bacterium]|nr:hypothetical protein [Coriobacteriales bacterium]
MVACSRWRLGWIAAFAVLVACTVALAACSPRRPPAPPKPPGTTATIPTSTPSGEATAQADATDDEKTSIRESEPLDDSLHTPKRGSAERKAVLDALRVPVEGDLEQEVVFKINRIAVHRSFAFVNGMPLQPDGDEIDYSKTKFADDLEQGIFDAGVLALLKRENGTWTVLEYAIGATDFPGDYWAEQHGAPKDIIR